MTESTGRSNTPLLRAVFFDLDDTLCDTIGTRETRARLAFEALVREQPKLDREAFVAQVMEPTGERIVRGVPAVIEGLGLSDSVAGRSAVATWFFDGCIEQLCCIEGVRCVIESLSREYVLGVVTNGAKKLQQAKFSHLGLEPFVRHLAISEVCGFEKPDVRIFAYTLSLAGVGAGEAVFVGDRLDVDVGGAEASGMRAVWFNNWGGVLDGAPVMPDAVIKRFEELPGVLKTL